MLWFRTMKPMLYWAKAVGFKNKSYKKKHQKTQN